MAKITRFNGNLLAFGINATGTNRTIFGDVTQSDALDDNLNTDYFLGWEIVGVNENPTREDFNALGFTHGQILAYLHQMGVPEWNTSQEYHIGSFASVAGVLYESQTNSNVGNDPTADSATNWLPLKDNRITVATITPASDANVTLTRDEYSAEVLVLTDGAWTAARSIIVPNESRAYRVDNSAGTYNALIKTAAGTGVTVRAGDVQVVYCDGVNVYGDYVWTAMNDTDFVKSRPTVIDTQDWDSLTTAGVYTVNNASGLNAPPGSYAYGILIVSTSAYGRISQEYHEHGAPYSTWVRVLLPAGWSVWRRQYNQTNILGTVSQSGGVPTGRVIERGSNANGEYVRFADGTQICTFTDTGLAAATAYGAIYKTASVANWTFPAAFAVAPYINGTADNRWVIKSTASTTQTGYLHASAISSAGAQLTTLTAIGRWF